MKPITPKTMPTMPTMPAITPADIPLLLLPSAFSSLSFGMSVLPGALFPVNKRKKGQTITICPCSIYSGAPRAARGAARGRSAIAKEMW